MINIIIDDVFIFGMNWALLMTRETWFQVNEKVRQLESEFSWLCYEIFWELMIVFKKVDSPLMT